MLRPMPSITARRRSGRVVFCEMPVKLPWALGSKRGQRSPDRYGWNMVPWQPMGARAASSSIRSKTSRACLVDSPCSLTQMTFLSHDIEAPLAEASPPMRLSDPSSARARL